MADRRRRTCSAPAVPGLNQSRACDSGMTRVQVKPFACVWGARTSRAMATARREICASSFCATQSTRAERCPLAEAMLSLSNAPCPVGH